MHEVSTTTAAEPAQPSFFERLNPLNNIPALSQSPVSPSQQTYLSLERTVSSIPRAISTESSENKAASSTSAGACPVVHDAKGKQKASNQDDDASASNWVYPSPQQFYNALMRKGKDTPEESIDVMVQIHNFLNEKAWDEVRRWEDMRTPGERIELARFEGRPQDLSPKARFHLLLGSIFSNTYSSTPPFDRHDWYVRRPSDGTYQRYVIDYYSAPDDEQGNPVFSLDVRPALDSPGAVVNRMQEWARLKKETWLKSQTA
ncbi:cytochrome c and c1 heme-lyase [Cystobasidium minutum MCA 4210]|uniref:cytochrome c and c1 heme-lyase n=1 Tax=Cystobasidium minutum MCA 4210 TaxID=1397322 RepID=UPI0034CE7781|eukprot:jgi/Rhomi1/141288/e_gw1.2.585.1